MQYASKFRRGIVKVAEHVIYDNRASGIKVQQRSQGRVCGTTGGDAVGDYRSQISPTATCQAAPPATNTATPVPTSAPPTATSAPAPTGTAQPIPTSVPAPAPSGCSSRVYAVNGRANTGPGLKE